MSATDEQAHPLDVDPESAVERITTALRQHLASDFKRKGYVVGMSGGVDSSVTAALAVRAVGPQRVLAILMPERESDPESMETGLELARQLGLEAVVEEISAALEGAGCYRRRDDAIRRVLPQFGEGWRCKLVLPADRLRTGGLNVTYLVARSPRGEEVRVRLPAAEYRQIVAASNFKQRVRKMIEYYHADRLHYAVLGTPNRLEYDQGFFVKGGDGLADIKPIAHLYKRQVYQLARHLALPDRIVSRTPTTDTFSLPQTQEEFYYSLPTHVLDVVLHGFNAGRQVEDVAADAGLTRDEVLRAYRDIEQKRATTRYLHLAPVLLEAVIPELVEVDV